jgi:hypothetical protein
MGERRKFYIYITLNLFTLIKESLGDMPFKLQSIPWQAIPIALLGVSPLQGFDKKRVSLFLR